MGIQGKMSMKQGKDRLIVALDVPTHKKALELVKKLDNVSFFKIGLELLMAGNVIGFIRKLHEQRSSEGGVFLDIKLSGDIGNTITMFVEHCKALGVKFITVTESASYLTTLKTIQIALKARGENEYPKLLMVPLLSSLDADDFRSIGIDGIDTTQYILEKGGKLLSDGCDGLIVSGEAIKACRYEFSDADIVSPGIRPIWSYADDHKRHTTPSEAINLGSDYLVVGRPILSAPDKRDAAQKIIDEVDEALVNKHSPALV